MLPDYLDKMLPDELWDHYTRAEEYSALNHDKFGRFMFYQSRHRDIFSARVSEYLVNQGYSPKYPDNRDFAVCLTHDIDVIYNPLISRLSSCAKFVRHKNWTKLAAGIAAIPRKKKPYFNFREIMDLEEKYNARSSFYFFALKPGDPDYSYDIRDVRDELKEIDQRGYEVGLHGGHTAWNSFDVIAEEKKRLEETFGKSVTGYRNHFLRFKVPDTWEYLAKAGFKYDATIGYADCAGFRNGMCHPYYPYNLKTEEFIDIMEIPLVVMDGTLWDTYMRLSNEDAFSLMTRLIDTAAELHGVFTLLWHNSSLVKDSENQVMYEKILAYCNEKNAWMTSGKNIHEWFTTEK